MKKSTLFHFVCKQWDKKTGLFLLFLFCTYLFAGLEARAQASSYMFASNTGTYQETSSSATTLPALLADTAISGVLEIGFDFVYEGNTYTQFKASSNGFISFKATAESLTANNFSTANTTSRPIIAPLWDDLDGRATGGSLASYETTGTSPNRVLTVEWRNWEWNWNSASPVMSFQVKLYETTNVIEFAYRQESGSVLNGSASIGIGSATGSGEGSFLNITSVNDLTVSSTTNMTTIATKPLTDQIFTFTPPTCLAPTQLNAENLTSEAADLFWTSEGNQFDLEWGAVGFVPEGGEGTQEYGLTSTSTTIDGLAQATSYHYYVRQNCGSGDLSNWSGPFLFKTEQISATLPYVEDFEGTSGWEFVNGTQANKWIVGTAAHAGAENAMYISNDAISSYAYTVSGTQASHAFRNIEIPSGTQSLDLSFDWKAKGEGFLGTFYDYITVWVVPVDFTLTAGTAITAAANRIQVGARLNNVEQFTTANHVVDVSAFDGAVRLVFEWRNDFGGGTQPPGAIDNVSISATSCIPPTALAVDDIDTDSAVLSWTSDGAQFDVTWGAIGFTPEEDQEGTTQNVTMPHTLENLTSATSYQYYVRQNCGGDASIWVGPFTFTTLQVVATLPYTADFETEPHNWTLSNGSQTNKWAVGAAPHEGAENALFISNDNGVTNAYAHTTSVVHAFREIVIPDGTTNIDFSFDWRGVGETCCDYVRAWVVPITFMPSAGTQIIAANGKQIGANFNASSSFNTYNNVVDLTAYAGQTVRLVFEWRNDGGGGTAPAGAVDNVSMSVTACTPPSALAVSEIGINTAELSWESDGAQFDVAWGAVGFTPGENQIGLTQAVPVPHTLQDLTSATTYQYYVRQNCGDNTSIWVGPFTFTTLQVVATLPYSVDFETEPNNWTLSNGNQVNKWVLGTAAHAGAENALYISNDNGVTNAYTHTTSVVHAFRELEIPDGTTNVDLSFDWRGVGETCCDYIRVWVTPITFMPTTGTQIVAANGKQIGGNFNASNSFNTYNNVVDLSAYAGQTVRLVFEWRNDGGGGTAPAGAIDNVSISVTSCSPVTALVAQDITANTATLSWTTDGNLFDIEYGPSGFALGTGTLIEGVANSYALENLSPSTNYQYYVRQNCGDDDVSIWSQAFAFKTTQVLAYLPYTQNFENDDHSWEFNNATHVNKWYVGDAVNNGGDRAMYISNDNGVTNTYTTSTSVTHAFKDIQIPDNAQNIAISFDWRCVGEGTSPNYYDYFRVWVVPATFTPTNGNQISATNGTQIGAHFNGSNTFTQANFTLNASAYQGQVVRLVFEFRSDVNGGVQPPAAIDNISIIEANCLQPTALDVQEITASSAELSWTSDGAAFDVQWGPDGFVLGTGTIATAVSNPHTLDQLNDAVAYQFYVRQNCGTDASIWAGPFAFMTPQVPVSLPYSEDFETVEHGWSLQNGNQINKWFVGDGVSGMNTLFISNDGGETNAYATGSTSLTHAYRSIQIPEGTDELILSFDWRAVGDGTDYLKAWIVPETLVIVPGTQIATAAGNIPVGGTMNLSADFTTAQHTIDVTALAGQTARLVFEWRNDYLGGVQTPAAIDNVSIELEELGVNNPQKELFKYYPNPVTDVLNFSYDSTITDVTVFNVLGQQVMVKALNATSGQIDMSDLASGNYIVKVQTEGLTKTIKVVKQ
ncbi:MAG: T9SS type A sorting domain-containing protein [Flavobacterium sp.]|nr:MAG: T9SS type A sorting domain-containing protein [Flavobacterium sp.]